MSYENLMQMLLSDVVGHPECLQVQVVRDKVQLSRVMVIVRGHNNDTGRMIGGFGKTRTALQLLVNQFATRRNEVATIEILEGWTGTREAAPAPFIRDDEWTKEKSTALVAKFKKICETVLGPVDLTHENSADNKRTVFRLNGNIPNDLYSALQIISRAVGKTSRRYVSLHVNGISYSDTEKVPGSR